MIDVGDAVPLSIQSTSCAKRRDVFDSITSALAGTEVLLGDSDVPRVGAGGGLGHEARIRTGRQTA